MELRDANGPVASEPRATSRMRSLFAIGSLAINLTEEEVDRLELPYTPHMDYQGNLIRPC